MKIRAGDAVLVIAGKDRGKQGAVIRVLPLKNRLVVEGVNMRIRHIKRTAQQPGQRISYEASIHASNVMVIDPKTKKPTRIGYSVDEKTGAKKRVARVSGEVLPKVSTATAKPADGKKGTKAASKTEKGAKESKVKEETTVSTIPPKKQPFWKRAFSGDKADAGSTQVEGAPEDASRGSAAPVRRSRESS